MGFGLSAMPGLSAGSGGLRGSMLASRGRPTMSFHLSHVIPSVAEESKNPEMESRATFSDSSATLGMTWEGGRNDIAKGRRPPLPSFPPPPYRHSRRPPTVIPAVPLPSFPRKRESRTVRPKAGVLPIGHFWIPAYAGMTVERGGNDGRYGGGGNGGMTVERGGNDGRYGGGGNGGMTVERDGNDGGQMSHFSAIWCIMV